MSLDNLNTTTSLLPGDDFFLGMASSTENSTYKKEEQPVFLKKKPRASTNEAALYRSELIQYKHDIELIKQSGVHIFRFSLSWSRIIPKGTGKINQHAVAFYDSILDICSENEVEPIVSLYDSGLPAAIQLNGGWSNREILIWFDNYVAVCVNAYRDKVTHWTVFSEPSVFTGASSFFDIYPSNKNRTNVFSSVLHHALLCQSLGFKKIKQIAQEAQVGSFFSCNYCIPLTYSEKDVKATERIDALLNRLFIEPSLGLGYPVKAVPFLKNISKYNKVGDDDLIKVDFDFIGLQNCTHEIVCHDPFIPYFNAKIVDYEKLRVQKNHLSIENFHELMQNIVQKYSEYEVVKNIFIDVSPNFILARNDINDRVLIKNYYNFQTVTHK